MRQDALQLLIGGLKFRYIRSSAKECAMLLSPLLLSSGYDCIVPIPTTLAHKRVRGYDHMELIAIELSKATHKPINRLLRAVSDTTQHHLSRKERFDAASSLFELRGTVSPNIHYLIIDDIITTGSTVRQAARLLRQAGAKHVSVAAIARQPSTKLPISVKMGKVPHETTMER